MDIEQNKLPVDDVEYFDNIKSNIERDLGGIKKCVDKITQMTMETVYLQTDLITTIDASSWEELKQLIGLTSSSMKVLDGFDKTDRQHRNK